MSQMPNGRELVGVDAGPFFVSRTRFDDPLLVVAISGELDLAGGEAAVRACTASDHVDVTVDMAGLEFMDCAGYGALVLARTALERRGGSLTLINACGEPLRLLSIVHQRESGSFGPVLVGATVSTL